MSTFNGITRSGLGPVIRAAIRDRAAWSILGDELESWSAGGCWILATALQQVIGGRLYAVLEVVPGMRPPFIVHHVVVKLGDFYYDSDGDQTEAELIAKSKAEIPRDPDLIVRPFTRRLQRLAEDDIVCPAGKVQALRKYLDGRLHP